MCLALMNGELVFRLLATVDFILTASALDEDRTFWAIASQNKILRFARDVFSITILLRFREGRWRMRIKLCIIIIIIILCVVLC